MEAKLQEALQNYTLHVTRTVINQQSAIATYLVTSCLLVNCTKDISYQQILKSTCRYISEAGGLGGAAPQKL